MWMRRRMHILLYLSPLTNLKSKCMKVQINNKNPDTPNLTGEKVGNNLDYADTKDSFLNKTLITQAQRSTINKWNA